MITKPTGGPAFPLHPDSDPRYNPTGMGMSLRDYYAGKALEGQCAFEGMSGCDPEHIAGMAYQLADALLKARTAP